MMMFLRGNAKLSLRATSFIVQFKFSVGLDEQENDRKSQSYFPLNKRRHIYHGHPVGS